MGLAGDATSHFTRVIENGEQKKQRLQREAAEARIAEWQAKLAEWLPETPLVLLDVIVGEHPVRNSRQYGGYYISENSHTIIRFRVDDVVLWHADDDDSNQPDFHVEVPCARCGRKTGAGLSDKFGQTYGWEIVFDFNKYPVNADLRGNAESMLTRFKNTIGKQLTGDFLCWDCTAQVGSNCEVCHRSWSTGVDWRSL